MSGSGELSLWVAPLLRKLYVVSADAQNFEGNGEDGVSNFDSVLRGSPV